MTNLPRESAAILALRRRLGITQEELARRLGATVVQIDRWEHGYSRPESAERALLDLTSPHEPL